MDDRVWRAGDRLEDLCRACKELREHTVVAADSAGKILRVVCGFCGSQHNYRGGERAVERDRAREGREPTSPSGVSVIDQARAIARGAFPLVSDRERIAPPIALSPQTLANLEGSTMDLEQLLRRIVREEAGVSPVVPADKWRGGQMVLKPGKPGVQEKAIPIETLFHKVVMIRNKLRVLEQQINAMEIPEDQKVKMQAYVTGCYGSLTTFNVLFAEEDDRFQGQGD